MSPGTDTTAIRLSTPLTDEVVGSLHIGDRVLLSGVVYSGRDTAHLRLVQTIHDNKPLPLDLEGQVMYYMGPSPARPGKVIGAAGPTTSNRMDPYTPALLDRGLKGMIGKGPRGERVREAMKQRKAVYFAAVGGAGALIAESIVSSEIIAYEGLGPEAIRRLEVKDFPLIVANDCHGGDLFEDGVRAYAVVDEGAKV